MRRYLVLRDITVAGRKYQRGEVLENDTNLKGLVDQGFVRVIENATRRPTEAAVGIRERVMRRMLCN